MILQQLIISLKKTFFILFILSLTNYSFITKKKSSSKNLIINLYHESFDDDFFLDSDFYYSSIKIGSLNYYPNYNKYIKENYTGIPKNDSVSFYHCLDDKFFQADLYKFNDLSKEGIDWYLAHKDIDTLNNSKVKLKSTLIILIGFYESKQFIIADANRNKDFSDDIKYEYDINFRNAPLENIDLINKQPVTEYVYEDCLKGNIQKIKRKFVLYPDKNNRFSISNSIAPMKEREYFSILKFRDYWKGETMIDNDKFDFIYHGYRNNYGILTVKPSSTKYENNFSFESQFTHKYFNDSNIDDTISINKHKFMIDSISRDITKLYLREVGISKHFGYSVGNYISNIELKDLEKKSFTINSIIGEKKYTLIEFWGTWCGPCVSMTPKIKELNNKFNKNLTLISVAVDDDINNVKKYIKKHNMNWKMAQIPKNKSYENDIIKKLKITYYPTFILLDREGKIISRDDPNTFDKLLMKIKSD